MGSAHWSGGRTPGFQPCRGDQSLITMATAEDLQKKSEMNDQLREYISQWRDERSKEEAELKRLKDKQAARKEIRAEQEKKQAAQRRAEEEKIKKEEQDKKEAEAQAKKKQVEEEMKISLSIRIKPLALEEMDSDELKNKANQIWSTIVSLETDKYDYEQRQLDQDYEFKELAERQKLQLRNKAIKKGLDPESFTQKHPPTIHMFSKYERRTDTRSYGDRKKLYEGGAEVIRAEWLESMWKEKVAEVSKRPAKKLPKWFGVRPGKKAGDPETPEGEVEAAAEEAAEEEYEEEEEDYEEEEEEEE